MGIGNWRFTGRANIDNYFSFLAVDPLFFRRLGPDWEVELYIVVGVKGLPTMKMKRSSTTTTSTTAATNTERSLPDSGFATNRYMQLSASAAAAAPTGPGAQATKRETVQSFVAFLYDFIRDEPGMVQLLDRALKARYAATITESE